MRPQFPVSGHFSHYFLTQVPIAGLIACGLRLSLTSLAYARWIPPRTPTPANLPKMVVFYDLERHDYASSLLAPVVAPSTEAECEADPVICRCLQVRQSSVMRAVEEGARSLCQIACSTGAGGGCTACHRKLRQYFVAHRRAEAAVVPALAPALQDALDHGELNVAGSFCGDSACLSGGCSVMGMGTSAHPHSHPSATADSSPSQPR